VIPLFKSNGAHVLVDGQFGSTGKGALAAWLAHRAAEAGCLKWFAGGISSAGPNSGHTSYFDGRKIVLKQLPTFPVHAFLLGHAVPVYLSAGAIIDPETLFKEAWMFPNIPIFVDPMAAVVTPDDKEAEHQGTIAMVAGTRSGTGSALVRKIRREPRAVWKNIEGELNLPTNVATMRHSMKPHRDAYMIEVAQGFSLGINSDFYPKVTSRECTVMQAIADARIPPRHVSVTYMCMRTFPIRVGDVDGYSSGEWYADQYELEWSDLEVEPERTTVTNRIRRVASFSEHQLLDAIRANDPDWIAMNFMNYLSKEKQEQFLQILKEFSLGIDKSFGIITGHGPNVSDWTEL
jgi:adenylosuccinate synthase